MVVVVAALVVIGAVVEVAFGVMGFGEGVEILRVTLLVAAVPVLVS